MGSRTSLTDVLASAHLKLNGTRVELNKKPEKLFFKLPPPPPLATGVAYYQPGEEFLLLLNCSAAWVTNRLCNAVIFDVKEEEFSRRSAVRYAVIPHEETGTVDMYTYVRCR